MKLNKEQIEKEMKVIADSGMEEILILTGESRGQERRRLYRRGRESWPGNISA